MKEQPMEILASLMDVLASLCCEECNGSGTRSTPSFFGQCSACEGTGFDLSQGSYTDYFGEILS